MEFQIRKIKIWSKVFSISESTSKRFASRLFVVTFLLAATEVHAVTIPAPQTSDLYPDHLIIGPVGISNQRNDPPDYYRHTETWTFIPPGSGRWDFIEVDYDCHNRIEWTIFSYSVTGAISGHTDKRRHRRTHP
ncbi:hypothetical protein FKG94_28175, partial [Exilibacterium tricleocarpae]